MANQFLHDLIDELENAVGPVKGLLAGAEARINTAITALRAHAEADAGQLLADAKAAGGQMVRDVEHDAAPVVADIEHDAADLAQTAQGALSGQDAGQSAPAEPNTAAEPAAASGQGV